MAYLELFSQEQVTLETLCPNMRQLSIAMDVVRTYMHRLAVERYGEHIYDLVPWTMPFAQWLLNAAQAEPLRQRFLQIDWTDIASKRYKTIMRAVSTILYHTETFSI